jgi:hypothetical protein
VRASALSGGSIQRLKPSLQRFLVLPGTGFLVRGDGYRLSSGERSFREFLRDLEGFAIGFIIRTQEV